MEIKKLLELKKRMLHFILGEDIKKYETPIDVQKEIINSFPIPKSLYERSYFQYICQNKRYSNVLYSVIGALSNIGGLICLLKLLLSKEKIAPIKDDNFMGNDNAVAVFIASQSMQDRIPLSLYNQYIIICDFDGNIRISKQDKRFIIHIWKLYPFSFMFVFKNAIKIGLYSRIINDHTPKAIICTSEDSYTSSILTLYCRDKGVEHINIMHGEMTFTLPRAFSEFDKFYVWDDYYANLIKEKLRGGTRDIIIEIPKSMIYSRGIKQVIRYKYYLQNQSIDQLRHIKNILDSLNGSYAVRPHPIWTNISNVKEVFDDIHIEDPKSIGIEESLMGSEYIISYNSTVLFQAYINSRYVVIDDITNPRYYKRNVDVGYIMVQKEDRLLLSDILTRENKTK